ncbi:MAG: hypothetical protein SNJ56_05340, partial [Termitinemataceae bacterium]
MQENCVSSVPVIDTIHSILKSSEQVFLSLGDITPAFVNELHENLKTIEQSIFQGSYESIDSLLETTQS